MKALLVIDMQETYINNYSSDLINKINVLIEKYKTDKALIIYIKNIRKLKTGNSSYPLARKLLVLSDFIIEKGTSSSFSNNHLKELLELNKIKEIEIAGIDGSCCVFRTTKEASELGYHVTIDINNIGIKNINRFNKQKELLLKHKVSIIENNKNIMKKTLVLV